MIRIRKESASILNYLLSSNNPRTNEELSINTNIPLNNMHRRTLDLFERGYVEKKLIVSSEKRGRRKILCFWITPLGINNLKAYEERQKKRPYVQDVKINEKNRLKYLEKQNKKPPAIFLINSIFSPMNFQSLNIKI